MKVFYGTILWYYTVYSLYFYFEGKFKKSFKSIKPTPTINILCLSFVNTGGYNMFW